MENKSIPSWITTYGILLSVVVSAVLIAWVPGKSIWFLCFLLLNMLLCIFNRNYFTYGGVVTFRTLVGLVFIYSSISKGVDPLGTTYQIQDYLEAYHMSWLSGLSVLGSFMLNLVEFCIGVFLLLNIKFKWTVWALTAMMAFFTCVTIYDAVAEPVPDCGCFGKALVITNWQTFYKNLVLDAGVLVLLFSSGRVSTRRKPVHAAMIAVITAAVFLGFEFYNYRYLPVLNFLEWKKGERLMPESPLPMQHYMTYRHKTTGQTQEYLLEECPFSDAEWVVQWEFVDRRDVDPNPKTVNINIMEKYEEEDPGTDVTRTLLQADNYLFLVATYNLDKSSSKGMDKVVAFVKQMQQAGYDACFLTASSYERAEAFKQQYGLEETPMYFADDKSVEAVIRSNPGVVLVRDAYVLGLWDWRRLPAPQNIDLAELNKNIK